MSTPTVYVMGHKPKDVAAALVAELRPMVANESLSRIWLSRVVHRDLNQREAICLDGLKGRSRKAGEKLWASIRPLVFSGLGLEDPRATDEQAALQ